MLNFLGSLYLTKRFYIGIALLVVLFIISYGWPISFLPAIFISLSFLVLIIYESWILFGYDGVEAHRKMGSRFSNGDKNKIQLEIRNSYSRPISLSIIDEIPFQFQRRDLEWKLHVKSNTKEELHYLLKPVKRGEYSFGQLNIFAGINLNIVNRRFRFEGEKMVRVYPSFLQMRKYEIAAISHNLKELGIKKIRKIGNSLEFEQIKDYVQGDDPRSLNWKASARANTLMVNQYRDERSQQMYCLIDKGRLMKMPFKGLSLLDYAINASLVVSNIAIKKGDKAGFISFSNKLSSVVTAQNKPGQMNRILEGLYNQKTKYLESNYELLSAFVKKKLSHRSLLLLFTNFESLSSLRRQLPYLVNLSKSHVLVVIFFSNSNIKNMINSSPSEIEGMYHQTIAEHLQHEKILMVKELKKYGIFSVFSEPQNLTVNTINKYLEVKALNS